ETTETGAIIKFAHSSSLFFAKPLRRPIPTRGLRKATKGTLKIRRARRSCPLWVISRHVQRKRDCPLYPQKRTCAVRLRMFAFMQKRTFNPTRYVQGFAGHSTSVSAKLQRRKRAP